MVMVFGQVCYLKLNVMGIKRYICAKHHQYLIKKDSHYSGDSSNTPYNPA